MAKITPMEHKQIDLEHQAIDEGDVDIAAMNYQAAKAIWNAFGIRATVACASRREESREGPGAE
eukprot:6982322-Prorocentrum_lima.AAC.1